MVAWRSAALLLSWSNGVGTYPAKQVGSGM